MNDPTFAFYPQFLFLSFREKHALEQYQMKKGSLKKESASIGKHDGGQMFGGM